MMMEAPLELKRSKDFELAYSETGWQVPQFLSAMLHNIHLSTEKLTPPVEAIGEFWFWRLSIYGLDLMHALMQTADKGFSYLDCSMEADPACVAQFVLLKRINHELDAMIKNPLYRPDWKSIFEASSYLQEKCVRIDTERFQQAVNEILGRIERGYYELSGSRQIPFCRK